MNIELMLPEKKRRIDIGMMSVKCCFIYTKLLIKYANLADPKRLKQLFCVNQTSSRHLGSHAHF